MNDRFMSRRPGGRSRSRASVETDQGDFDVIRELLDEAGSEGSSSTLEAWRKSARERLAGAAREAVSPARARQIRQVEEAYEVATELVEAILRQARAAR